MTEGPSAPYYRPDQLLGARHDHPDTTGELIGWEAEPGRSLIAMLTSQLAEKEAQLCCVRQGVLDALDGLYMPTPAYLASLLYPAEKAWREYLKKDKKDK